MRTTFFSVRVSPGWSEATGLGLNPGIFQRFKKSGGGVLLYGPPGYGKTMAARAIANECNAQFTAIGISDIINMWAGESKRNLASISQKARSDAPAVLFFDELDALAFSRSKAHSDHTALDEAIETLKSTCVEKSSTEVRVGIAPPPAREKGFERFAVMVSTVML